MHRYLIEIEHGADGGVTCKQVVQTFLDTGSHYLTHADWGCFPGVHCGWLVVEVDSREEATMLVPPELRPEARVVELNKFTREEIASLIAGLES